MRRFALVLAVRPKPRLPRHATASITTIAAVTMIGLVAVGGGKALAAQSRSLVAQPSCGGTITADTTLGSDLANCPGDGIVIGADNITLDLNGHTIDGDATSGVTEPDIGVRNDGHDGVTIEGGSVQEFDRGVGLNDSSANRLLQLTVINNSGRAINAQDGSNANLIEGNNSSNNGRSGIVLLSSDGNVVRHNTLSGNGVAGFGGFGARHNVIEKNVISSNGDNGMFWSDGSDDNQIDQNSASDNSSAGVIVEGSNRNEVTSNHVFRNGDDIIIDGDDNTVIGNLVSDALGCDDSQGCGQGISAEGGAHNLVTRNIVARTLHSGIRPDAYGPPAIGNVFRDNIVRAAGVNGIAINADQVGPVTDTVLDGNVAIGSSNDGIYVGSASTTLTRNLGMHNGTLGIEAVPGVIDGGGNHAAGNGNPAQCTNVAC